MACDNFSTCSICFAPRNQVPTQRWNDRGARMCIDVAACTQRMEAQCECCLEPDELDLQARALAHRAAFGIVQAMPSITQTIPQNVVRHLRVATFANATGLPSTEPLMTYPSPTPDVATIAVSASDPMVVDITPGTVAGSVTLVVNKTPQCPEPLLIHASILPPANLGRVEFVELAGPDTPKP